MEKNAFDQFLFVDSEKKHTQNSKSVMQLNKFKVVTENVSSLLETII